jgi:hypothetical protein
LLVAVSVFVVSCSFAISTTLIIQVRNPIILLKGEIPARFRLRTTVRCRTTN